MSGAVRRSFHHARLAWIAIATVIVVRFFLMASYALHVQYVMDEYDSSSLFFRGSHFYRAYDPIKTVLYVYFFGIPRLFTHHAVDIMRYARCEALALALAILFLTFRAARNLGRNRLESAFTVAVLLSVSTFLERAFRVRADTVGAFFAIFAIALAIRRVSAAVTTFGTGFLSSLAFLNTQKAVWAVAALGFGYATVFAGQERASATGRRFLAAATGGVLPILLYALYFGGAHFASVLQMIVLSPLHYGPIHGHQFYPYIRRYLSDSLERNALAYLLCFAGLLIELFRWPRARPGTRFAAVVTFVMTVCVFTHSQPWPYVLIWCLPLLALWSTGPLRMLSRRLRLPEPLLMVIVLVVMILGSARGFLYLAKSNRPQDRVVTDAESLLGSADRYWDGIAAVVSRRPVDAKWWDAAQLNELSAAARRGDEREIEAIVDQQPKVWIFNYRSAFLWPILRRHLVGSYVPVYPDVLLTGCEVDPKAAVTFRNRWAGPYWLFDASGRRVSCMLIVDGLESQDAATLSRGNHRLSVGGIPTGRRYFLLPAGLVLRAPLPSVITNRDLYAGVYD